jgi:hypothetical protein
VTPVTTLLSFGHLTQRYPSLAGFEIHREHEPLPRTPVPMPTISGACFALRRRDFEALDGLDEGYFLHVEDNDLSWRARQAAGEHSIPALMEAMDSVLDEQASKLAIQRRYIADMRDIWSLQPRLEKGGRGAARAMEHLRFRAGYDFLLLRVEAGELPAELGRWWTDFVDGDSGTREQLLDARPGDARPAATKRRRRRRSGARKGAGEGDAAGDAEGEGADGGAVGHEPDDDPRWREIPGQGGGSPRDRDPPA